jgi:hypothetical protein
VRRTGWNRAKLDGFGHQSALDFFSKELRSSVCLDALDRERHLIEDLVEEDQRRRCARAPGQAGHEVSAAVINCGELIEPRPDLTEIHLDAVTRHRATVALRLMPHPLTAWQHVETVPDKDLTDDRWRQPDVMKTPELRPDPLHAKAPLPAQGKDQLLRAVADLPAW